MAMTLKQLAKRLNDIIAENEARGWSERNDLPACVTIGRKTPKGKVKSSYRKIRFVSGSLFTINGTKTCGDINVELEEIPLTSVEEK